MLVPSGWLKLYKQLGVVYTWHIISVFCCQFGWSYITYSPSPLRSKPAQHPMDDRKAPFRWFRHTSRPRCMRPTNRGNTTRCRWKSRWKRWRPGMMPRPEVRAWQVLLFFCWCFLGKWMSPGGGEINMIFKVDGVVKERHLFNMYCRYICIYIYTYIHYYYYYMRFCRPGNSLWPFLGCWSDSFKGCWWPSNWGMKRSRLESAHLGLFHFFSLFFVVGKERQLGVSYSETHYDTSILWLC